MELNREQIIKALECCTNKPYADCKNCPYETEIREKSCIDVGIGCFITDLPLNALSLIKELTEENERLRAEKEAAVDDLKDCMYYAKPKRPNTCNFCIHDCEVSKDGTQCKGKDDWIYCSPIWRGVVKAKAEGE